MTNTNSIITILICVILIVTIAFALIKGIWSAAKKITIPIQVVLFVVILVCVGRMLFTKENARKLYDGIDQTGISQNMERTMRSALKLNSEKVLTPVVKPMCVTAASVGSEPPTVNAISQIQVSGSDQTLKSEPVAVSQIVADSKHVKAPDYSHLNKGKKSYTYALPFNAKVTVGFKENTYRVITESLGVLASSEKKEIGKLIFTSLGKYVGRTIEHWDKSKVSIESRYDEVDNQTLVFAIIPPDAID